MGTSASSYEAASRRVYNPPNVRKENRYRTTAPDELTEGTVDVTVDKYDYLIVFPNSKGKSEQDRKDAPQSMQWRKARAIWLQCVPGDDCVKEAAVDQLATKWRERTTIMRSREGPEDDDEMQYDAWLDVAKHTIIDQLYGGSGLQLKVSAMGPRILCRVRAPVKMMERQAELEGYRLQFKGEVDPGYAFWDHTDEIELEQTLIESRDEANDLLERLYQQRKISPVDIAVFDDETKRMWSRRIRTLERIADRVPVDNQYPASVSFRSDLKLRHLFQTYPSVRGRTLFRSKDRLYLTFAILRRHFDFELLAHRGVIDFVTALHDANRGDRLTREVLFRRWITFWKTDSGKIGAPLVTHPAINEGVRVPWYLRPFSQPLMEVREYFGEKLAFYFAWLGFYTFSLIVPATVGLAFNLYFFVDGYPDESSGVSWLLVAFALFITIWTSIYTEFWKREQSAIAVKWGMHGFIDVEKDRPQFQGDKDRPQWRSHVTNRMETYFSDEKRMVLRKTARFLFVCVALLLGAVAFLFDLEYFLETEKDYWWGSYVCSLYSAVQIQLLSAVYGTVVKELNDWENHRTETTYQDNLIFKTFLFQIVNNYAALTYTAYIKPRDLCSSGNCMHDMRELLISIFLVRFLMNANELGAPYLKAVVAQRSSKQSVDAKDEEKGLLGNGEAGPSFVDEVFLVQYDGTFDDYAAVLTPFKQRHAEIVIQFGYVTLFAVAMPLILFLALLENVVEIRVDAFKMCWLTRRPHIELAEDVGAWGYLMQVMMLLGVLSNTALIVWTSGSLGTHSSETKWFIFLAAEHAVLCMKYFLQISIEDFPEWLRYVVDRQRFVVQKHLHGFDDSDAGSAALLGLSQYGHLDFTDAESLSLDDLRNKGESIPEIEREEIEKLKAKKRDIERELTTVQGQLQMAYRSEVFNEATGVGETRHGLPLGFLNLKLVEIDGLAAQPTDVQMRISLKSTKPGDRTPPGPSPELSKFASRGSREGALEFNQAFVFAPIRFIEAEIVFDIIGRSGEQRKRGTAKLHLRELADQADHDVALPVAVRDEPSEVRLYVQVKFMYSKIVPLRNKIFQLRDDLRTVEKDLARRKAGRRTS